MNSLYKILSFLLLPIGLLFGMITLMGIFMAFSNTAMLLTVFMAAATTLYIFLGFIFSQKGIMQKQPLSKRFKDWLKANSFVALVFAGLGLLQTTTLLLKPEMKASLMEQFASMPQTAAITEAQVESVMQTVIILMGLVFTMLLAHVILTFRLLKTHSHLFEKQQDGPSY